MNQGPDWSPGPRGTSEHLAVLEYDWTEVCGISLESILT
jgi:hypothetical protein